MNSRNKSRPTAKELRAARHELYLARLSHVRSRMVAHDVTAMIVSDPNHIFYITGASNMELWAMRSVSRYLLLFSDGPAILYDAPTQHHLANRLPTLDDVRVAEGLDYLSSGADMVGSAERFARQIVEAVRLQDLAIDRLHIDRLTWQAVDALRAVGFQICDAQEPLCLIRAIKLEIELPYIREAMRRVEAGVARLESKAEPGKSESETWAEFHYTLMAKEGQYISTRLFQSGPNTYPYFQEAGSRALQHGDLLCLDTDALGFEHYAVDFSRTFLCGDGRATDDQRLLYGRARDQLEHNADLLAPHVSFRELAEKAWHVPEEHRASRYYCVGHGLGMAGEYPNIPHIDDGPTNYPLWSAPLGADRITRRF